MHELVEIVSDSSRSGGRAAGSYPARPLRPMLAAKYLRRVCGVANDGARLRERLEAALSGTYTVERELGREWGMARAYLDRELAP
jgi:hypothetical protein